MATEARCGTILILNGTSSSGKTSIVRAIQDLFEEPFVNAGLDRLLYSLPERYLERPLWDDVLGLADRAGGTGLRLVAGLHSSIAALARAGNNVVADHVLVEPAWLRECARLFAGLPAYLIGVRCPLEVAEERERARKTRTLGQARLQFERVHAHGVYDLELDTSRLAPEECALAIKGHLEAGKAPFAFRKLAENRGP